jgi:hypothetical protein
MTDQYFEEFIFIGRHSRRISLRPKELYGSVPRLCLVFNQMTRLTDLTVQVLDGGIVRASAG